MGNNTRLSPRQKMINLMYIVLTAMLALNVSSDVLNGFTQVEEGLKRTNNNVEERNAAILNTLQAFAAQNPDKGQRWYDKAAEVRRITDGVYLHIDTLKQLIVKEADGSDADGEESENGVDFANMMRYNRSYIARIIQSSDDVKNYYGEVRTALLSYRKVNSNIAWGAERFHKGRETIARFKIRGKTLVLYMALDPAELEYSVYHHKDVSDNKSLHGTPTMIKIKSPRGVKKAVRLVDLMLEKRDGVKRNVPKT